MTFYAVAHGFKRAIFEKWNEAKTHIEGFPQSVYKKFDNKEDAEEYFHSRQPKSVQNSFPSAKDFPAFYAVARGHSVGVFGSYDEVKEAIADYPQPLHKKFDNLDESIEYINKYFHGKTSEQKAESGEVEATEEKKPSKKRKSPDSKGAEKEKAKAFYAVARGHETGVFPTWDECKKQTTDFKGAKFKKFDNEEDAKMFAEGKTLKQIDDVNSKSGKRGADVSGHDAPEKKKKTDE